jgi:hypothetical protein
MKKWSAPVLPSAIHLKTSHTFTHPFFPSLSANPFRELRNLFCRLPLPTFLHNTIGCSPWRPEAVYSTVMERLIKKKKMIVFSRIFCSRKIKRRGTTRIPLCRIKKVISRLSDSNFLYQHSKRKDNSSFRNKRCLQ